MSLTEYKSPVLKKPKFGWQRYQFGNKSAAELKLSLWDANLSEVFFFKNIVPLVGSVDLKFGLSLKMKSLTTNGIYNKTFNARLSIEPYKSQAQLASQLNKAFPFLGQFIYHVNLAGYGEGIQLIMDKTYLNNSPLDEYNGLSSWDMTLQ